MNKKEIAESFSKIVLAMDDLRNAVLDEISDPPKPAGVIARPGDVLNSNVGTIWIVQTRGAYRRKMGHDIRAAHYPVQSACGSLCEQPINSGYMWMKDSGEPIAGYEDD
jgi:hypothetical protein